MSIKVIKTLAKALEAAQDHLEYCGYGDNWERECARENKLEEKIEKALKVAEKYEKNISNRN